MDTNTSLTDSIVLGKTLLTTEERPGVWRVVDEMDGGYLLSRDNRDSDRNGTIVFASEINRFWKLAN
jgi:hypothetical protein